MKFIIKKLKIAIMLLLVLLPSNLGAKTAGNYLGIDFIKTNLSFAMENTETNRTKTKSFQTEPTSAYSYGVKYNYAINYRGAFISPGIFFEANNAKNNFNISSSNYEYAQNYFGKTYSKISKRYGVKLDIGVDINEGLAIYGSIGQAINHYTNYSSVYYDRYRYNNSSFPTYGKNTWATKSGKKSAPFYGAGFRIKLAKNWLLNGEYSYTRFTTKTNAQKTFGSVDYDNPIQIDLNNNINIFKIGLNYNF